jgi:UDP-N-acetylmuramyl pentapeptide synthase
MSELGSFTESGHREVGQRAARTCDLLVTVGDLARQIAEAGLEAGLRSGQVASFDDQASALHLLRQEIDEDDIVLVKGSQSARMEKITAALLADPSQASKLLVRQGSEWVGAA